MRIKNNTITVILILQIAQVKPDSEEEEGEYEETFTEVEEVDVRKEHIDLEEFKEIHEVENFQSKVNFFENSVDTEIKKVDSKHIINNIYRPDPKDRIPREISANNINKMNNLYDKYNQMKKDTSSKLFEDSDNMELGNSFSIRPPTQVNENKPLPSEVSDYSKGNKYNPINDINNEDSLIKDLTKFRKFALNEINQSE
jgi:hypothetical protein